MAEYGRRETDRRHDDTEVVVTACETRPGRVVFTEEDNTDAWIATDLTVELDR